MKRKISLALVLVLLMSLVCALPANAASYKLFDAVTVEHKAEVVAPRSYQDYTVTVADTLPEGVHCERFH